MNNRLSNGTVVTWMCYHSRRNITAEVVDFVGKGVDLDTFLLKRKIRLPGKNTAVAKLDRYLVREGRTYRMVEARKLENKAKRKINPKR